MRRVRSPRQNTILIFLIITLSIALIVSSLTYYLILGSFVSLEEEQSRTDMTVILNTLSEQGASLASSVKKIGVNDDTYQFLLDDSPLFINTTFGDKNFEELQVNFLIVYNRTGDVFYSKGYSLVTSEETQIPDAVFRYFSDSGMFLTPNTGNSTKGIVRIGDTAVSIATSSIAASDKSGLSRGSVVIGRYIDTQYIEKLSDITNRPIDLEFVSNPGMAADVRDAEAQLAGLSSSAIYVHPVTSDRIASYTLISDIQNTPSLILKTERSRDIYTKGLAAVEYFIFLLAVVTVLFVVVGLRLINNAFTQIDRNIEQFAILGDHIRNPLTVIVGLADLHETEISSKIIEQAKIINEIVNKLDSGWIESEKIKEFLRKYSKR
jgi:sensor domain CHASE-containing protein